MSLFPKSFRMLVPATALPLTLGAISTAHAAQLSGPLSKSEWTGGMEVPAHVDMYIGLPDNMPESPPIIVNLHACGGTNAGSQWSYEGFAPIREAMETVGFIMIVPQQSRNCWAAGETASLTHDGGGDFGAIIQMIKYAIETYNADPTRVYAMGGSGGGNAVQGLLAVYPEVFKAGHARAGTPAGCWAEAYEEAQQWSGPCSGGSVNKTPQEWGDYVRAINPDFSGPWPRIQINQGSNDETISFNNFQEGIDEWTNVHGLDLEPTSSDMNFQGAHATYDRQFWEDACGYAVIEMWEALGMGHSMGYESVHILEFFGLDQVREQDPWDEACGDFVDPGQTGEGGAGDGSGGAGTGGAGEMMGEDGMGGTPVQAGGMSGAGDMMGAAAGASGSAGASGGAGIVAAGGASGAGMAGAANTDTNLPVGMAGAAATTTDTGAGTAGTANTGVGGAAAGTAGAGGAAGGVGMDMSGGGSDDGGCSVKSAASSTGTGAIAALLLAMGLIARRRRD